MTPHHSADVARAAMALKGRDEPSFGGRYGWSFRTLPGREVDKASAPGLGDRNPG